jgi:hypothetical protein
MTIGIKANPDQNRFSFRLLLTDIRHKTRLTQTGNRSTIFLPLAKLDFIQYCA